MSSSLVCTFPRCERQSESRARAKANASPLLVRGTRASGRRTNRGWRASHSCSMQEREGERADLPLLNLLAAENGGRGWCSSAHGLLENVQKLLSTGSMSATISLSISEAEFTIQVCFFCPSASASSRFEGVSIRLSRLACVKLSTVRTPPSQERASRAFLPCMQIIAHHAV